MPAHPRGESCKIVSIEPRTFLLSQRGIEGIAYICIRICIFIFGLRRDRPPFPSVPIGPSVHLGRTGDRWTGWSKS